MKKKEKKYSLLKGILLFILVAIVLSWLIPVGSYETGEFVSNNVLTRIGINDISWIIYYALSFSLDKIMLLLAIGGFYGVLVKTGGYERIVTGIASRIKHQKIAVVIFSCLLAILASVLTQTFVVLLFVPFIISILNRMKLDKTTILATAFGSILVGVTGATYGTDGFITFIKSLGLPVTSMILVRAGILIIGLVLFNFFTLAHMNNKEKDNESTDMFSVLVEEETKKNKKKASIIPIVVVGVLLFVIAILGYLNWNDNFGITVFNNFHTMLNEIEIGDFRVFESLLGKNMGAFGTWDLFQMPAILILATILIGLCYKVSLNDFFSNYINGLKKMIKPALCVVGAFLLLVVVYDSTYIATVINKLLSFTDSFNLATMSISALIANVFHTDLGYTGGFLIGGFLAKEYVDYINPISIIFTSLYGIVQFFIPTSVVLGIGLTSLDVKYIDWLKHIWRFILGMLICLLVIFILITII